MSARERIPIGDAGTREGAPRVMLVLPYDMTARALLTSRVVPLLSPEMRVLLVTRRAEDAHAAPGAEWAPIYRPFQGGGLRRFFGDLRFAIGFYWHLVLVYRFSAIRGFRGFLDRRRQSRALRRQAFREGFPTLGILGFPFPRARWLYDALYALYYTRWQRQADVEALFDRFQPDALVLGHLQNAFVTPYVLAAQARRVPILGLNGSWDQPTTKGPLCLGLARVVVQSAQLASELAEHHAVAPDRIAVAGWPQLDIHSAPSVIVPRTPFLATLGLPPAMRYLLLGAYSERLGAHEPAICEAITAMIAQGRFGPNVCLYVRAHPVDADWQRRLGHLHRPPHCYVEPPSLGNAAHLTNLIAHAAVLMASGGTINVDAVALDTPSIALALDDPSLAHEDQPARRYDMEHQAALLACGGVRLARGIGELATMIARYLADPATDAAGRKATVERHLAPLDGRASERTAAAILDFVREHACR